VSGKKKKSKKAKTRAAVKRAHRVLAQAQESVKGLFETFDAVKTARGAVGPGSTTDKERDLLRAGLVFAAAGLDATVKELIRGTIVALAHSRDEENESVRKGIQTYVERRIKGELEDDDGGSARKYLARIITRPGQHIHDYVEHLTGSSLQSAGELIKAAEALGLSPAAVGIIEKDLRPIFAARNKIIHELDVDLDANTKRAQTSRKRDDMTEWAAQLLAIAEAMITEVEKRLPPLTSISTVGGEVLVDFPTGKVWF
jgi:hypothetical protein